MARLAGVEDTDTHMDLMKTVNLDDDYDEKIEDSRTNIPEANLNVDARVDGQDGCIAKLKSETTGDGGDIRNEDNAIGRVFVAIIAVGTRIGCFGTCAAAVEALSRKTRGVSRAANAVVSHELFDQSVVCLILVNCVFLAFDDPTAEVCTE